MPGTAECEGGTGERKWGQAPSCSESLCRQLHWTHLFPWACLHLSVCRALPHSSTVAQLAHLRLHPAACVPFLPETACRLLANFTLADIARLWLSFPLQFWRNVSSGCIVHQRCLSCFSSFCDRLCLEVVFWNQVWKPSSASRHWRGWDHRDPGFCSSALCWGGRQRVLGKRGHLSLNSPRKYVLLYVAVKNYPKSY